MMIPIPEDDPHRYMTIPINHSSSIILNRRRQSSSVSVDDNRRSWENSGLNKTGPAGVAGVRQ